ncbi:MAG: hypothetical protein AB8H80_09370 [Planctomycetota bacterium]
MNIFSSVRSLLPLAAGALAVTLPTATAAAQVTYTGTYFGTAQSLLARETYLPSAAFPNGSATSRRFALPSLQSVFVGTSTPSGGIAVDQFKGRVWAASTTSVFPGVASSISVESNPHYGGTPTGSASLVPLIGPVRVEGLAIDSVGTSGIAPSVLFLLDGTNTVNYLAPTIPPTVVAPPVTLVGLGNAVASGIAYDSVTNTLWVSTRGGRAVEFSTTGIPTGQSFTVTGFSGILVGCAVNTSSSPGFVPPPAGSAQQPGAFRVCVVDLNGTVMDAATNRMIPGNLGASEVAFGLGASADPQILAGASTGGPSLTTSRPITNMVATSALVVNGIPPGANGVIAFDTLPLATPLSPAGGGAFWLNTASPSFVTTPLTTVFPLPVQAAVHGLQFTAQVAILNPALALSDALVLTVGAP